MTSIANVALWLAAIGSGIMAGIYFAFSTFVMKSLHSIPEREGIAAMQAINLVILTSPFLPLFFGTTLLSLGLAGYGGLYWREPGAWALIAGGTLYVLGMFGVTLCFNVPLNDALKGVDPTGTGAATLWEHYEQVWSLWNHVRTVTSAVAMGLFVYVLTVWSLPG